MADGSRTHDLRNHNPVKSSSNPLLLNVLTSTADFGCSVGCSKVAETGAETPLAGVSEADAMRLATLTADANLAAIVDGWNALPKAVRAGITAMVRSCGAKG